MFTGEYRHSVDAKGRVAIPARFRLQFEDGAVVTRWLNGCAGVYTKAEFAALAAKVAVLPITDEKARAFSLFLFSSTFEQDRDTQGRIILPPGIREWAALGSDVVVVGAFTHLEIWNPDRWVQFQRGTNTPDALRDNLSGLGI